MTTLRTLIIGGTGKTYIEEFANSVDGWEARCHLPVCYKGEDAKNAVIVAVCKVISASTWE